MPVVLKLLRCNRTDRFERVRSDRWGVGPEQIEPIDLRARDTPSLGTSMPLHQEARTTGWLAGPMSVSVKQLMTLPKT